MNSIEKLKTLLENDPNIIFALIFGSGAGGKQKKGRQKGFFKFLEITPVGELLNFNLKKKKKKRRSKQ